MPVLLASGEPDYVTGADLFDWPVPALNPSATSGHDKSLTKRMRVPSGPGTRLKRNACALNKGRIGCLKKWIDADSSGEPVGRALRRRLRPCSFYFHL
jgi:hypothetical protein